MPVEAANRAPAPECGPWAHLSSVDHNQCADYSNAYLDDPFTEGAIVMALSSAQRSWAERFAHALKKFVMIVGGILALLFVGSWLTDTLTELRSVVPPASMQQDAQTEPNPRDVWLAERLSGVTMQTTNCMNGAVRPLLNNGVHDRNELIDRARSICGSVFTSSAQAAGLNPFEISDALQSLAELAVNFQLRQFHQ